MTARASASPRVRVCPKDGYAMELDREVLQASVEAGWPAVELLRCRNGHSVRFWPVDELAARRAALRGRRPCAVCGLWLGPPAKYSRQQVHPGACVAFRNQAYNRFLVEHPGQPFLLEEQPWYRGILAPLPGPPAPLDPLAGQAPRDWLDGWARSFGYEAAEPAA